MDKHERLQTARRHAGYETAADAARALNVTFTTYAGHENGSRGFDSKATRYAHFFRVDLNWLLTGKGMMTGRGALTIPLHGIVTAGNGIVPMSEDEKASRDITLPEPGHIGALLVKGDSQYPRWMDGEVVLFDTRPTQPRKLLDHFAVVQDLEGRRMLKRLREGRKSGTFMLESLNAPPEHDVELLTAHRYVGTLGQP